MATGRHQGSSTTGRQRWAHEPAASGRTEIPMTIHGETENPGELVRLLRVRGHALRADVPEPGGGGEP